MNEFIFTLNSSPIKHLCSVDKQLSKIIFHIGDLSYSLHKDSFSFLVHEIIEQMLSVQAGNKIYSRLLLKLNSNLTPESILSLSVEEIKSIGMSYKKANCIFDLASEIQNNKMSFDKLSNMSDEEVIRALTYIRGIGPWTSKMYLLFVLNRMDVLPYEDGAFIQSFKWLYKTSDISKDNIIKRCQKWSPYSSIASRYMYQALNMGMTKTEFSL